MLELAMGLLSGAGSLISGLGARSAAKSQQRRQQAAEYLSTIQNEYAIKYQNEQRAKLGQEMLNPEYRGIDVSRMVADAKLAGFNPITYLNAGAAGYYDRGAHVVEAYNMMLPERMNYGTGEVINVPSVGQAIGGAITSGIGTYTDFTKMTRNEELQKYLQNQKLDFLGRQGDLNRAARSARYGSGGGSGSGSSGSGGGSGGSDDATNPFNLPFPAGWTTAKGGRYTAPDSNNVGDRYNSIIGGGYGFGLGLQDWYANRPGWAGPRYNWAESMIKDGTAKDAQDLMEKAGNVGRAILGLGPYRKGFWSGDPWETYRAARDFDRNSPTMNNIRNNVWMDQGWVMQ